MPHVFVRKAFGGLPATFAHNVPTRSQANQAQLSFGTDAPCNEGEVAVVAFFCFGTVDDDPPVEHKYQIKLLGRKNGARTAQVRSKLQRSLRTFVLLNR